jgi:hypothetical protein
MLFYMSPSPLLIMFCFLFCIVCTVQMLNIGKDMIKFVFKICGILSVCSDYIAKTQALIKEEKT